MNTIINKKNIAFLALLLGAMGTLVGCNTGDTDGTAISKADTNITSTTEVVEGTNTNTSVEVAVNTNDTVVDEVGNEQTETGEENTTEEQSNIPADWIELIDTNLNLSLMYPYVEGNIKHYYRDCSVYEKCVTGVISEFVHTYIDDSLARTSYVVGSPSSNFGTEGHTRSIDFNNFYENNGVVSIQILDELKEISYVDYGERNNFEYVIYKLQDVDEYTKTIDALSNTYVGMVKFKEKINGVHSVLNIEIHDLNSIDDMYLVIDSIKI